jgi:hypothetical protein
MVFVYRAMESRMWKSSIRVVLSVVALTLLPASAFAFTCGTPGGGRVDCTCPPGTVKECKWRPPRISRCLCVEPGPNWGINPGGKAEVHKKNVPTVKPGGGGANAYGRTLRPRTFTAPYRPMQRPRWRMH